MSSTALLTDKYELTMLRSLVDEGIADQYATFELFARRLPAGRRFGIVAGLSRFLDSLERFTFDDRTIEALLAEGTINEATAARLSNWRFTGEIRAYAEGELYWPGSPVLQVSGRLGDAILLETLALSIYNHDSAIASAAARMVLAAGDRPIIEMGSRRVHEQAAVAAARAAYIAGFASTSNMEAGRRYRIPVAGTAAHAFTLAHRSEAQAFRQQMTSLGVRTTLLVDTYDIEQGIRTAVEVAREFGATGPGAIRIDSGDLVVESHKARQLLDSLGATQTRITVTSDLDEYVMTELATAPIDGYGAGTRVATGSGHPTAGFVYKLVEIDDGTGPRPVQKKSASKSSTGGRKYVFRTDDGAEYFVTDPDLIPADANRVHGTVWGAGFRVYYEPLASARARVSRRLAELPAEARKVSHGESFRTTVAYEGHSEYEPSTDKES